jgi:hypothetical protein
MAGNYIREVVKDEPVEIDVGYHQAGQRDVSHIVHQESW